MAKVFSPLRRHPRKLLGTGAVLLLLLAGIPIARTQFGRPDATPTAAEASTLLSVETLTAKSVNGYEVVRTYTGEITALRSSELGFERGGQLVSVLVQEGDRVTPDTPLAQLDISTLKTQRQQQSAQKAQALAVLAELKAGPRREDIAAAEANVRQIEQDLALQQTQRKRREFLYGQGAISREELDKFAYGQSSLQARLDQARSNLAALQNGTRPEKIAAQQALIQQLEAAIAEIDVNLRQSTLTAPFSGIVSTRQVDEGTVVSAGQSVVRLLENAAPEARIGMPAAIATQLQIGEAQTVTLKGDRYPATVTAILPEIDPETRTQIVVFQLDRAAIPFITPGQTVRAELTETIPTQGIWLPTTALAPDIRGLWSAYVLTSTPQSNIYAVQPQAVEILHQQSDRALVRGTLQAGDRVVANGSHRLVPGQQVRLLN